jgi:hypothetical protein
LRSLVSRRSCHWYISTSRRRPSAGIDQPKSGSTSGSSGRTSPETWISLPCSAASTRSVPTDATSEAPSSRLRVSRTARPSFHHSRTKAAMQKPRPTSTPAMELPIRRPQPVWLTLR